MNIGKNYELFNVSVKEKFLSIYENQNTKDFFRKTLERISVFEDKYDKDLSDFNDMEVHNVLVGLNVSTVDALNSRLSVIRLYIDWANSNKGNSANHAKNINLIELQKNINSNYWNYINRDDLINIVNICSNPQDAALFVLLFEGVKGKGLEEIINLKVSDCDFANNSITIRDKDNSIKREIVNISNQSMEVIEDAINQTVYLRVDRESNSNNGQEYKIISNDFVVRQANLKNKSGMEPVSAQVINDRIKKIVRLLDGCDGKTIKIVLNLNPSNIYYSGMIDKLQKVARDRILLVSDFKDVIKQYGGNPNNYTHIKNIYETIIDE